MDSDSENEFFKKLEAKKARIRDNSRHFQIKKRTKYYFVGFRAIDSPQASNSISVSDIEKFIDRPDGKIDGRPGQIRDTQLDDEQPVEQHDEPFDDPDTEPCKL